MAQQATARGIRTWQTVPLMAGLHIALTLRLLHAGPKNSDIGQIAGCPILAAAPGAGFHVPVVQRKMAAESGL
jgi:hypothetical protein